MLRPLTLTSQANKISIFTLLKLSVEFQLILSDIKLVLLPTHMSQQQSMQ